MVLQRTGLPSRHIIEHFPTNKYDVKKKKMTKLF